MTEKGDYFQSMPFPQTEELPPPKPQPKTLLEEMFTYNKDVSYEITPENAILDKEIFPFSHDGSGNFARAFRQFNVIEPLYRNLVASQNWNDEEGYDALKSRYIQQVPENHRHRFMNVASEGELLQKLKWYRNDMEDMEMLMTGSSFYPIMTASLFSPTTFAPLAPISVLRSGSVWNRFAKGALFTSAVIAPEELLSVQELHSRDAGHAAIALAGASLIGGTLTAALGGKAYSAGSKSLLLSSTDSDQIYRSAGASANPSRARETARATMEGDALAETGIGLEKLSWNPTIRLLKSDNWVARKIAPQLVDIGGMIQKKVRGKIPEETDQSVETTFRARWLPGLLKGIKQIDKEYLTYRNIVAKEGDIGRSLQMIKTSLSDLVGDRGPFLTQSEFRVRVSQAMRRKDVDPIDDGATPFVNASARELRKHFNDIRDEAVSVRLFERQAQKVIAGLKKQLSEATDPAKKTALQDQLNTALANLTRMRTHGVNVGGEYLTRIFRQDKVLANQEGFLRIAKNHFMTNEGMNATQASAAARGVLDEVTHGKPYLDLDDASQIDWITQAGSSKARTFGIKDDLIEEFLENDIEVILRHHTKTMGTDIELTRAFGDINMRGLLDDVVDEYKKLMNDAPDANTRRELKAKMENDLRDIKGLRDRIRGTYGASKDPHQLSSRFVRGMKSFNILVGMGSATLSSIPDIGRVVMTEGFTNFNEKGLKHFFKQSSTIIKQLSDKELRQAGIAADAILGLRASAFSDVGDLFGSRMGFERGLNKTTGMFFLANGLNYWNQTIKSFAGNVIMMRMTQDIMRPWTRLSKRQREKFLANGINQQDHSIMQMNIKNKGQKVDGEWMPNTELWTDRTQAMKFRKALNQSVDRTIVTPGAGDRALWTSTEIGSLITQFKGYGQGATVRVLTSGLQEKDQAFWQGAFLMVGLAYFVNEAKKIQYGIEKEDTFMEGLINAIDRSGTLGWFTDVNNSLEKISDFKIGMRAIFGDDVPKKMPVGQKIGAIAGPAGSNLTNIGGVAADVLSGNGSQETFKSARFSTPGGNLTPADPIYDFIFGT
nr:putative internal virion protein [uncultured Mediterranean phage uvMED]